MIGTERTFADRQRTAIERLRVGVALLMLVETGEIVQRARDVGMVRSQHLFADRERAPDRRLGLRIAVEVAVELAEIVQERRDRRMLGATGLLVDRERALKQLFRQQTGMTVGHYLRQLQLCQAKYLLRTQDCLISEVAARCGFDDSNYFSVVFTRETGLTPSAWRQRFLPQRELSAEKVKA